MRILSITAQKPNSTGSGVYLTELVKGFERAGHCQAVVAGIHAEDIAQFSENVQFYPVYYETDSLPFPIAGMSDEMPYPSTVYSSMTEKMVDYFQNAFITRIGEVVEAFKPDIILCHHLYLLTGFVREAFCEHKVIAVCHGTGLRQIRKNQLKREYIKSQIRKLDMILALHQAQKEEIIREFGINEDKVKVIGTGYNDRIFYWQPEERAEGKTILLFAGKLSEKKGVMSLLRSLEYLNIEEENLELWMAGGYGNQEEYKIIRELANTSRHRVVFLGKLDQIQLAKIFNQAHILVLPSFYEGLPLVVIEAMACGLKVVCSRISGIEEWIRDQIGQCPIRYVTLPDICNADEPVKEQLPDFEKRLAAAITESMANSQKEKVCLSGITWDGICKKITEIIEEKVFV